MNGQRYFYLEREAKREGEKKERGEQEGKKQRIRYNKLQNVVTSIRPVNTTD